MSRKIILIKQELLLLVYELNRSGLLAENEKIRPILAQLEKLLRSEERRVGKECRSRGPRYHAKNDARMDHVEQNAKQISRPVFRRDACVVIARTQPD